MKADDLSVAEETVSVVAGHLFDLQSQECLDLIAASWLCLVLGDSSAE